MQCGFPAMFVVGGAQTESLKNAILFFSFFRFLMAILPLFFKETVPNVN